MSNLYSIEAERNLLSGLINNPSVFPDVEHFVKSSDFFSKEHGVIFSSVKEILLEKKELTQQALSTRIKNLGIKFKGELDIADYIEVSCLIKINEKATKEAAQEVLKLRALRDIEKSANEAKKILGSCKNNSLSSIITQVDSVMAGTINGFSTDDVPENLFEGLEDDILILGDNPIEGTGLKTPFANFDRLYGELRGGNVYGIASRPAEGKTTFLTALGQGVCKINSVPVLYLDTEMSTKEIKLRMAASLTGVPLWYVETGNWNKNAELRMKMKEGLSRIEKIPFFHYHVGNKTIDEVITIIRRWYWSIVGRGKKCLIIYDYLKLTGEKVGANWAEYQAIGEKTDKLKRISIEIDSPVFTAIQINRSGVNSGKNSSDVVDDSSVIAQSDRVLWFVSFLAIFRRKTVDERLLDGDFYGTHKMIDLKTRYQGKDAAGHQNLIERKLPDDSKTFTPNYIAFDITNFSVKEKGTLEDIVKGDNTQIELTPGKHEPTF